MKERNTLFMFAFDERERERERKYEMFGINEIKIKSTIEYKILLVLEKWCEVLCDRECDIIKLYIKKT